LRVRDTHRERMLVLNEVQTALGENDGKRALKLTTQAMKKKDASGVMVVLRLFHALALDMCGRYAESSALCSKLIGERHSDETVLKLLTALCCHHDKREHIEFESVVAEHVACAVGELAEAYNAVIASTLDANRKRELELELFYVHVRRGNWKLLRSVRCECARRLTAVVCAQMAVQLLSVHKDSRTARWGIITVLLQAPHAMLGAAASRADDARASLKLATSLLARDVTNSFTTGTTLSDKGASEMLVLYVDTLERQSEFDAMVGVLSAPGAAALWRDAVPRERERRLAAALAGARRWRHAFAQHAALLDADADDWLAWMGLFDALVHFDEKPQAAAAVAAVATSDAVSPMPLASTTLIDMSATPSAAACVAAVIARARALRQPTVTQTRAPFLVEFEVNRRVESDVAFGGKLRWCVHTRARARVCVCVCASLTSLIAELLTVAGVQVIGDDALLSEYFAAFGHKPCYANDVRATVERRGAALSAVLAQLEASIARDAPPPPPVSSSSAATSDDETRKAWRAQCSDWAERCTNVALLREIAGDDARATTDALLASARVDALRLAVAVRWQLPYEHRESPQIGDAFALLAARRLLRAAARASTDAATALQLRMRALSVLAAALHASPHNFQLKLQLVHAYDAVRAYVGVPRLRAELDVRHVQLDSLSHVFLEPALAAAQWRDAGELCASLITYHRTSRPLVADGVTHAFAREAYSRVLDVLRYDYRLRNSQQLAIAVVEHAHVELLSVPCTLTDVRGALTSVLADVARPLVLSAADASALVCNLDERATAHLAIGRCLV
jgi:hypothetical protein